MTVKVITRTEIEFVIEVLGKVHNRLFGDEESLSGDDDQLLQEIDDAADILLAIKQRPNRPIPETVNDGEEHF